MKLREIIKKILDNTVLKWMVVIYCISVLLFLFMPPLVGFIYAIYLSVYYGDIGPLFRSFAISRDIYADELPSVVFGICSLALIAAYYYLRRRNVDKNKGV
jgi:ABC-type phosphate transport system permease subunit